ncbi:MAG: helix-turn-helix domain-containing protein [Clostridia bacterium]|nr:helix-turn-helix domain-containing protein [Clostridia bacterium]
MQTRIKELRVEHDLTQAAIAKAIGITQRKYSYIETQTQSLNDELICKLAKYYGVSADYILMLSDSKETK